MLDAAIEIVTDLPRLPPRPADSNKGTYGRILVLAGSRGMAGAGLLCASAALRAGAGLVKLGVANELVPVVAVANPCVMTVGLPGDDEGRLSSEALVHALQLATAYDVAAIGPGLGRSAGLTHVITRMLADANRPVVLDADGLNNITSAPDALRRHSGPVVITPHPGEFARLLGIDTASVQANRRELAVRFARDHHVVVVLKGQGTLVTDGLRLFCNTTGNPGMATAGSGDVLTGIVAALIGQGLSPFDAARLGTHLHGLAGDLAAAIVGQVSLIATDLIDYLPRAIQDVHH